MDKPDTDMSYQMWHGVVITTVCLSEEEVVACVTKAGAHRIVRAHPDKLWREIETALMCMGGACPIRFPDEED